MNLTKGKTNILGLCLADLTKIVLDKTNKSLNNKQIHKKENNLKPTKAMKK
ncbi:hypothetical protein [Zunongwangia sp.]|uniref:hypothetical protein n=1 Tax=Zunongwangia sp. TaxID=1965325 RepID=UPI003AA88299